MHTFLVIPTHDNLMRSCPLRCQDTACLLTLTTRSNVQRCATLTICCYKYTVLQMMATWRKTRMYRARTSHKTNLYRGVKQPQLPLPTASVLLPAPRMRILRRRSPHIIETQGRVVVPVVMRSTGVEAQDRGPPLDSGNARNRLATRATQPQTPLIRWRTQGVMYCCTQRSIVKARVYKSGGNC